METPDTQPPLDDYEANERDEIAETEADVKRHRVMKGHPPKGDIFPRRSEAESAERIKRLRESANGFIF
ncbi:MAG TPA: hypothetical protein VIU12_28285 [Chryseolinea sp.]